MTTLGRKGPSDFEYKNRLQHNHSIFYLPNVALAPCSFFQYSYCIHSLSLIMSNNIWFLPTESQPQIDVNDQTPSESIPSSRVESDQAPLEPELSLADLPDPDISLSQPASPQSRHRSVQSIVQDVLEPPTRRPRYMEPPSLERLGVGLTSPRPPLYPPSTTSNPPLPSSQASYHSREEFVQSLVHNVLQPPVQRPRNTPHFGCPGTSPLNPGPPIYPPLPTRVPNRSEPSAANRGQVRFIGDLLPGQARVLGQFLWVGKTEDEGPVRYFEATYEGPNDDQYWGLIARPVPPREGAVNWGHNRWLLGHPKELTEDQLAAHIGDMTHRSLRFLHLP